MIANQHRQYGLGEMLSLLRSSGCPNATSRRLHGFIVDGRLPTPPKNYAGDFQYDAQFIERARLLLLGLPSARSTQRCASAGGLSPAATLASDKQD